MIPARQFYCTACDEGVTLRTTKDDPRCPRCHRGTLVAVDAPAAATAAPEFAAAAFEAMRQRVMEATG
ncbi:MAG: hypothetical protein P4N60_00480 [Verrucomicrobiae bacterium]|nr:hypothetical protein [Verrucomicrobiae bacterium]